MKYFFFTKRRPHWLALSRLAMGSAGGLLLTATWSQGMTLAQTTKADASSEKSLQPTALLAQENDLPQSVRSAVIQAAANRAGIPADQFEVVAAEQRDWPDGCLGLGEPGTLCTQAIVPGWRVVVGAEGQQWMFRTDETGSQVALATTEGSNGSDQSYTDIQGHWAQFCIQQLNQQGTISGYPNNTFRPNNSITRAEYAAMLNQAFPQVEPERGATNFTDVPASFWGQEAIQTAYRKGFLSGYPNQQFRPNDLISRVETFVALASGLDYGPPAEAEAILASTYTDSATIPSYAFGQLAAITQQGAVIQPSASSTAFNPAAPATRAQVAASLCEIKFEQTGIPDGYVVNPVESPGDGNSPVLGETCTNDAAGYTVNYPTGWMTNPRGVLNFCQVFDPTSISLPERSSSFDEAIHLRIDAIPFERATGEDDIIDTELTRRTTTIDGYQAVVTESESTGRGLLPAGVRSYTYIIDLGNDSIMVASTYDLGEQQYSRNKQVLDQMMDSLDFNR
jgi:hypothetical protein